MTSSDIKQHLTVKNIFIAIVAMNILSAFSLNSSIGGGTFHSTAKVPPKAAASQAAPPALLDQNTFAHLVPGEAPAAIPDTSKAQPQTGAPRSRTVAAPPKSDPPSVSWMMLLSVAAMALYARYLAMQMVQTAVVGAIESVKHIAGAVMKIGGGGEGQTKHAQPKQAPARPASTEFLRVPRQPAPQPQPKAHTAPARKSTVVRASRWPLFS